MKKTLVIIFLLIGIAYIAAKKQKDGPQEGIENAAENENNENENENSEMESSGLPTGSTECEQPLRENFCLNGGTCFRLPGEGPPTDPNCVCRTGYTGNRCQETVIDFRKSLVDDF